MGEHELSTQSQRRTPLYELHTAAGAKLADFGGWDMPIEYPGSGVLVEHAAVREAAGMFDVSHLGTFLLRGPGAAELVNRCVTNDLGKIGPGQAQYTLWCAPDGGVVDDLIVYLHGDDDVLLMPNAANAAAVIAACREVIAASGLEQELTLTDVHEQAAIIAVQGPASAEVLKAAGLPTELSYMSFVQVAPGSGAGADGEVALTVCRTGYTGERGYEIICPASSALGLWTRLTEALEAFGGRICGLGARDTLRTEMGYPLHGHELSLQINPVEAGATWAVGWKKPEFIGREALLAAREAPARRAWGLLATGRGVPRAELAVYAVDQQVGTTTSGTFSPTLRQGIALALLSPQVQAGDEVEIDVRGRRLSATVVKPPFVPSHVRD